jgi:TadE-like protein
LTSGQVAGFCISHWVHFSCVAVLLFSTVVMGICCARLSPRERGGVRAVISGETGGLSEELVLAFPLFLFFLAMTVQVILILNARLMVNYAAFAAGRSASVWIASRTASEASNTIRIPGKPSDDSPPDPASAIDVSGMTQSPSGSEMEKYYRIYGAAALACAPISPNYFSFLTEIVPGYGSLYAPLSSLAASLVGRLPGVPQTILKLTPRWIYARKFTTVFFRDDPNARLYTFGPNEDIKITVQHKFHLGVPWVGGVLAAGGLANMYYPNWEQGLFTLGLLKSRSYYANIQESYVFRNEGEPLAPGY